ncbi:MAG: sel1 repeat family protein [Muribaculaceae bacterium]|nr:sel1 repeat family protein [Muribaculaceae bacterium]
MVTSFNIQPDDLTARDQPRVDLDGQVCALLKIKSAEQGYPNAQNSLGVMYQLGERVSPDIEEATRWFMKAADQGNANAVENLKNLGY